MYISIVTLIVVAYFLIRITIGLLIRNDYETLSFILIFIGIFIIVFGYWSKWYVYGFSKASKYMEEEVQRLRDERLKNNKLTINQKATLWILDGYGVRLCNKIGFTIILIGIIFLLINKII